MSDNLNNRTLFRSTNNGCRWTFTINRGDLAIPNEKNTLIPSGYVSCHSAFLVMFGNADRSEMREGGDERRVIQSKRNGGKSQWFSYQRLGRGRQNKERRQGYSQGHWLGKILAYLYSRTPFLCRRMEPSV